MKSILKIVLIIAVLLPASILHAAGPGLPAVFALNAKALEKNRRLVNANNASILPAYKQLLKDADKAMAFGPVSVMEKKNQPPSGDRHDYMSLAPYYWPDPSKPGGLPYIRKDGETNPEVKEYKDKEYLPKLCSEVHTLALAWYFSGEKKYAAHAAKLLRVWFLDTATRMNPNLNFGQAMKGSNTGRGAGMIDTRHLVKVVDAIGLLQHSPAWSNADQEGMKKWFIDFLQWMQTSKIGTDELRADNNHGAWYDAQRMSMALFVGDKELAKRVAASTQDRLDKQMDDKGSFPKEMERTTSLHYTVFAMEAFFNIAQMSETIGIDLWNYKSPSGKSLRHAFEVLKPYIAQEKKWEGQQIKEFEYEEGYMLLLHAADHFQCNDCRLIVKRIAEDKFEHHRINLLH